MKSAVSKGIFNKCVITLIMNSNWIKMRLNLCMFQKGNKFILILEIQFRQF